MEVDVRELLEEQIRQDIEDIEKLKLGSEERQRHMSDLSKLYGVYTDDYKVRMDVIYEEQKLDMEQSRIDKELEIKEQTAESEVKKGKLDTILKGATVVIGGVATFVSFKLEKDGHIVPKGFMDLLGKTTRLIK